MRNKYIIIKTFVLEGYHCYVYIKVENKGYKRNRIVFFHSSLSATHAWVVH